MLGNWSFGDYFKVRLYTSLKDPKELTTFTERGDILLMGTPHPSLQVTR